MEQKKYYKKFNFQINLSSNNLDDIKRFFEVTNLNNPNIMDLNNMNPDEQYFGELDFVGKQLEMFLTNNAEK
jgi:hypothetical protein